MIVIVGHGPSADFVDGSWLDSQTVVRLKDPYGKNDSYMAHRGVHPGGRMDFLCARHTMFFRGYKVPCWLFPRKPYQTPPQVRGDVWIADFEHWDDLWQEEAPGLKPSTGMCAIFCAVENGYTDIGLVGFDSFWYDMDTTPHVGGVERGIAESLATITNCSPAEVEYGRIGAMNVR